MRLFRCCFILFLFSLTKYNIVTLSKLKRMHLFWYHSPVRFYKTLQELQDMTNPQNTQYFGERNPYPLEIGAKHRFVIPMYGNTITAGEHKVFLVSGIIRTELESSVFDVFVIVI